MRSFYIVLGVRHSFLVFFLSYFVELFFGNILIFFESFKTFMQDAAVLMSMAAAAVIVVAAPSTKTVAVVAAIMVMELMETN